MKKTRILITCLTLALLFVGGAFLFNLSSVSADEPFSAIGQYEEIEKSEKGVQKYEEKIKDQNQALIDDKMNDICSTITFAEPISYEELIEYIEKYDIDPVQIQSRALQGNTRITIATLYGEGFDDITMKQLENYKDSVFVGYTDIYANVDYKKLDGIQKDSITYLVDTSADNYFSGNDDKNGKERNENKKGNDYPHSLTWLLEDLDK